ncbi:phage tail tube protein [Caldimonas sp. KR1-144]|uniref:phage tail tube protein n=1 Tax=Caldimonas sp. KR1-144 TaxID=3400911 RepID=UPI003C0BA30F
MSNAEITSRTIAIGKQAALGTLALTNSGKYQNFRPDTSGGLTKESFESDSVRRDAQYGNPRHGLRQVGFNLSQELQIGGHNDLLAGLLRAAWAAAGTITGTTIAVNAATRTITDSGNGFVTAGFKVGDIVRFLTAGSGATENEGVNLRLLTVAAGSMTYAADPWTSGMVDDAAGDNVTLAVPGKKLQIPSSAHTKDYFTIADDHADVDQHSVYQDCIVNSAAFDIAPGAHANVTFAMLGLDADLDGADDYFTTPTAAPTGALLAGPEGKIRYGSADSAVMTQLSLTVDNQGEVKAVIGANVSPDVFRNGVRVSGSMGALFDGGAVLQNFDDETEAALFIYLFADSTPGSEFLIIKLPNAKINSADKGTDGPAVTLSGDFSAGKYVGASTVIEATTIAICDSTVA